MKIQTILFRLFSILPMKSKRRLFQLEVEAKDIELLTVKDFVQRVCDSAGCTLKETSNIKLAMDEACSNIIRHAYNDRGGKISLEIGVGSSDLVIKVIDYGKSFDFQGIQDPDLNHYVDIGKKGGLGIWLIKKVMTDVRYKTFPDHNELILYYRLSKTTRSKWGLPKGNFSISMKFSLGSVLLIFVIILSAFGYLNKLQQSRIFLQQKENVTVLLQNLDSEAGHLMAHKSDLELDGLIREVLRADKDKVLSYVFVVSTEGRYIAHSDLSQLFKVYVPSPGVQMNRTPGPQIFRFKKDQENLTDYGSAVYFHGQWMGEIHVGESDASIQKLASRVKMDLMKLMGLILMVCVIGLYLLSRIFIKPLQKILDGVLSMSGGDFNTKIEVESRDEFGQLAHIFNDMTSKIQSSQKGLLEGERMQKEMQVAQEIQHTLLPKEFPRIDGFEIGAIYRAAKEVGGDYYDFFWVDPTTLGIVVADVSGKGVPGSLVMTMIRTAMRLESRGNRSSSDVLSKVNQHVTADMKRGMFVTMFYIILDSRNRSINFSSAGHNPMILFREKTKEVYFLKPKGFPVGIDLPEKDMFVKNLDLQKVSLEKNDMLLIYTDGITEAMNPENQQFGEKRLIDVIKENYHLTPAQFVEKLNQVIAQFTRGAEQNDDITIVAIKEKMNVEQVELKFRKKLLHLVDQKGLSVVEACKQMNTSTHTYYRLKKIFKQKGNQGLKPKKNLKRSEIMELTLPQQQAVMEVVREHPEYEPKLIVQTLNQNLKPNQKVNRGLILKYLKRKGLGKVEVAKKRGANQIDKV